MKRIPLLMLLCFYSAILLSQTSVDNPLHGLSTVRYMHIDKIAKSDTATLVTFTITANPGTWIRVPKGTYLQNALEPESEKIYITTTLGIPFDKGYHIPEEGVKTYVAVFPKLSDDVKLINYGEDNGDWFYYDISLLKSLNESNISEDFQGKWFDKTTGVLKVAFLPENAIYQSKVWKYGEVKFKKKKATIELLNDDKLITLELHFSKEGDLLVTSANKTIACTNSSAKCNVVLPKDDAPFDAPVLKADTTLLHGFIEGYSRRVGFKTMTIHVNDILTGEQNSLLIPIEEDGSFSIRIPIYYPHETFFRSTLYNGTIYLEPGKDLFLFFDAVSGQKEPFFMGSSATLANDFAKVDHIRSYDYRQMRKQILDMNSQQYKEWILQLWNNDLHLLDSVVVADKISAKGAQIKRLSINLSYADILMDYRYNFETTYKDKHKIPGRQRELPITIDTLSFEYTSFLTSELVNNPLAYLTSSYGNFINTLKYSNGIRVYPRFEFDEEVDYLVKKGIKFSESEEKVIAVKREQKALLESDESVKNKRYQTVRSQFYKKHKDLHTQLSKENKDFKFSMLGDYLQKVDSTITPEEQEMLIAQAAYENSVTGIRITTIWKEYGDSIQAFSKRYRTELNALRLAVISKGYSKNLASKFNIEPGQFAEIMVSQDLCKPIVTEYEVLSDKEMKDKQAFISDAFISEYLLMCNETTKARIEENKKKTGFTANDVPKTEADKVFDAIMEEYRGKVVFVDFWATWCGPCRSEIQRIAPLKEEMKNEDVVFVYISAASSPIGTWNNMIPTIKGEHYRVSQDEWNYLKGKFNISGIPHYALVAKDGTLIDGDAPRLSNPQLKTLLEKHMAE